jgi:hypothetical protein
MTATGWRGRERTLHFVFLIFESDKKTRWLPNEVSAERYRFLSSDRTRSTKEEETLVTRVTTKNARKSRTAFNLYGFCGDWWCAVSVFFNAACDRGVRLAPFSHTHNMRCRN